MKNFRTKWLSKSILLVSMSIIMFSSCKKDKDETNESYVGTWVATENDGSLQYKDNITFSKEGFTEVVQIFESAINKTTDYIKISGTVSVSGNIMNLKITEIGVSSFNPTTGKPTGIIDTYKEGTTEFTDLLTEIEQPQTFKSEFSISGSNMTIKTDNNNDGDYTDADETTVYAKK